CLRLAVPMRLWMVGRLAGSSWTVIQADDTQNRVKAGDSFPWPDTLCVRVLEHYGCCFAEDAAANPVLADAPVRTAIPIGAYIGYPMLTWRGELLGTICGIHPEPMPPFSPTQCQLVKTISRTINTLVAHSFKLDDHRATPARVRPPANIDHLTGLPNQHGWQVLLEEEETALKQEGADALAMMVELNEPENSADGAGSVDWDNTLNRAAHVLKNHVRERDGLARVGPARFALLLRGVTAQQGERAAEKIRHAMADAGIRAGLGHAMRLASGSLANAVRIADIRMYNAKLGAAGVPGAPAAPSDGGGTGPRSDSGHQRKV
ncbi:MAG: diguanylate cyclase domain-containing protein, partial [Burkholderiaceae bacterium]